tara:strand:+ start:458 stop:706 length:249 start_codon:yes stop_codon:yes gene_type:complete
VFGSPLVNLSEPSSVFGVFIRKGDTSLAVVHLFTAETLVARHKGRATQSAASAIMWAGVIVVCHLVFLYGAGVMQGLHLGSY